MNAFPVDAVPPIGDYVLSDGDKEIIQTAFVVFNLFRELWMDGVEIVPPVGTHNEVLTLLKTAYLLTMTPLSVPVYAATKMPADFVARVVSLTLRFKSD